MSLFAIAWKSLQRRALSNGLTALSVALGVMLMVAVLVLYGVIESAFGQNAINYDLIVGAKGSPLQLVLSTVYRIGPPIENLPYRYYEQLKQDPRVEEAIPIAVGDTSEQGNFPIVGTIPEFFAIDYAPNRPLRVRGNFLTGPFDAVIGSRVARENGWDIGSEFRLVHSGAEAGHVHDEKFRVVGVMAPTGTANDKTVFVHLKGFYSIEGHDAPLEEAIRRERAFFGEPALTDAEMAAEVTRLNEKYGHDHHDHDHAGHDHSGHDHAHDEQDAHDVAPPQKLVTAIFLQTKRNTLAAALLAGELKKGLKAQAVNPIQTMVGLMNDILGGVKVALLVMTALIVVVSGVGIFVSIYNSMSSRRREIGIYRALGASRGTILLLILLESALLCLGGGLAGLLAGHLLVYVSAPIVEARSGLLINPLSFEWAELYLIPALLLMGSLVGLGPALSAYRTDVAEALQN